MSGVTVFVQLQGDSRIIEIDVAADATEAALREALARAGVELDARQAIFVDESEHHLGDGGPLGGLTAGARVHVVRCRRITVTAHFVDKTIERAFPGARVRTVKAWAVREFHLDHKDGAEHVLQICASSKRPASDTPLHILVQGQDCAVCFDLVPEKRVEG